jgi:hypothetical protein
MVLRAHRDHRAIRVLKDRKVILVQPELPAQLDHRDHKVILAQQEPLAQRALRDHQARAEHSLT